MNIWAPRGRGPLPVFVWIHGGGFTGGGSFDPLFDGTQFAKNGIICITVAYRLGVLGFLDVEPLLGAAYAGSANNALRNLIAALDWIKQNIESFGEDPQRVTIGGESAGAKLTDLLMGIPSATPLFHQMISESGGADRIWPRAKSREVSEQFGQIWQSSGNGSAASILKAEKSCQALLHLNVTKQTDSYDLSVRPNHVYLKQRLRQPVSPVRQAQDFNSVSPVNGIL